jgi:hypothetical protein
MYRCLIEPKDLIAVGEFPYDSASPYKKCCVATKAFLKSEKIEYTNEDWKELA